MSNIHTPERLNGESFAEYKERRDASNSVRQLPASIVWAGKKTSRQIRRANTNHGLRIRTADALMNHFAEQRMRGNIKHSPV